VVSELPVGWEAGRFGDIVSIIRGVTFPASSKIYERSDDVIACLRTSHIQDKLTWDNIYFIPKHFVRKEEQITLRNDILMSMANSSNLVGKVCINDSDSAACFGAFLAAIRCNEINFKYVYHFLRSADTQAKLRASASQTVNIANISVNELEKLEIPLPPLAEQERIALALDLQLSQTDAIKARITSVSMLLSKFRQSVLASSLSGQLTRTWRRENPLPASSRNDIAKLSLAWGWQDLPDSWDVEIYCQVVQSRLGKMLDKAKNTGISTRYLGNINVRWNSFDLEDLQEIRVSQEELRDLEVKKGDVLICEGGEPGRCAVWSQDDSGIVYQKALHRARTSDRVLPQFLAFSLKNDADNNSLSQLFTGSTIKHLTGSALKNYPLRLPPVSEQIEIIARVEQLFAMVDHLEAKVATAKQRIDALTQSLLAKAFRGELTPQDPNDEPASVLLERIRAQRAAAPKPKRGRKAAKN